MVYLKLILAALRGKMEYKAAFFFFFFAIIFYYAGQIGIILAVVHRFKAISGWTLGEMAFLYGLLIFSQGIASIIFNSLNFFEELTIKGDFDRILIRPLNPLGQVLCGNFEVSTVSYFFIGATALVFGSRYSGIYWTWAKALLLPLVVVGAVLIQGGIRIFVAAAAFWTIRNRSLVHTVVYSSKELIYYPISIYNQGIQFFLTFLFPLAFINYYPSSYFLDKSGAVLFHPILQFCTPLAGVLVFAGGLAFWNKGLNRYQGTGN